MERLNPYIRNAMHDKVEGLWLVSRSIWDYELIYIAQGSMKVQINNKTYIANEGDFVFLKPDIPHVLSNEKGILSQPHVHFDLVKDDLSIKIYVSMKHKENMSKEELTWFRKDDLSILELDSPIIRLYNCLEIKDILYELIDEYRLKLKDYETCCKGLLLSLLVNLSRSHRLQKNEVIGKHYINFSQLEKYILENFERNPSLDDLAKQVFLSKYYFIKIFTEHFGKTPHQYIEDLRFERAKELLKYGYNRSILDVSETLNFDSQQSFTRWFKKKSNLTPFEYRKRQ